MLELAWRAAIAESDEDELARVLDDFQEEADALEADESNFDFFVLQSAILAVNAIAVHAHPSPAQAELSGQTLELNEIRESCWAARYGIASAARAVAELAGWR
ncbi:hypothetical protein ABZ319_23535 [Nocardia sp. NPDC005978]|uniref:hypothetical protein n=1 Tax=Nocardia sp. NPDC005978 TaxID=3156725 RepID=UPI0033A5448F